jgi:hypothetical protein
MTAPAHAIRPTERAASRQQADGSPAIRLLVRLAAAAVAALLSAAAASASPLART